MVRVFCVEEAEYKRIIQTVLDPTWIPTGCEDHTIKDFVVEAILD